MMQEDLDVFDLEEGVSWDEIRRAYYRKVKVWHPDRFAQNPDLERRARKKTQQLNLAYERLKLQEQIRKQHGHERARRQQTVNVFVRGRRPHQEPFVSAFQRSPGRASDATFIFEMPPEPDNRTTLKAIYSACAVAFGVVALMVSIELISFLQSSQAVAAETSKPWDVMPMASAAPLRLDFGDDEESIEAAPAQQLVSLDDDLDSVLRRRAASQPSLVQAAMNCDVRQVRRLINTGADVNAKDPAGDTPLAWAAKRNCVSVAKVLLAHGADPAASSANGFTPKAWARWYSNYDMENLLGKRSARG